MTNKKQKCKVCAEPTRTVFNIDFKAVPICEYCAMAIFIQHHPARPARSVGAGTSPWLSE